MYEKVNLCVRSGNNSLNGFADLCSRKTKNEKKICQ